MSVNDREAIHYQLLEALYKARKQVEYLEAALAHNAAYLGTGVERTDFAAPPETDDPEALPEELMRYLGIVGREADVSDYLGREGDDSSRPRLGADAPESIRPLKEMRTGRLVGLLAMGHPDDGLVLPGPPGSAVPPVPPVPSDMSDSPDLSGPPGPPDSSGQPVPPGPSGQPAYPDASDAPVPPGLSDQAASPAATDASAVPAPHDLLKSG